MSIGNRWSVVAAVLLAVCGWAMAEEQKFVCARDVWVSAVPAGDEGEKEQDCSMGKTPRLKLKTIQEMALLDFDLSALKGKKVGDAWLYFHICCDPKEIERLKLPMPRKHLLKRIGLSTVSTDWEEGKQADSYKVDRDGCGATFREASYSKRPWAFANSDLSDVTMGNGNTLQWHAELEDQPGDWARIKVPAELVQSLISRDGFGLCIMDELGQGLANNWISSREDKGNEPYLVVNVEGDDKTAPAVQAVVAKPAPADAHMGKGAVAIDISGSPQAFAYFVKINGKDVPRWMIPHPKAGRCVFVYDECKDGEDVAVEVTAVSAAGVAGAPAKAQGKASPALAEPPKLPQAWKGQPGEPPVRSGKMRAWAFPEISKVRPTNGGLFEAKEINQDEESYRKANSVWDGASNSVRLFGAKGEIVSCQVLMERTNTENPLAGITIKADDFVGAGKIAAERVKLFRVWYVNMAEYAVPMAADDKLEVPAKDNAVRVQNNQAVIVDVAIPKDAAAGEYKGKLTIAAEGVEAFSLPVALKVYDFAIPDKMRFNPELNIYGNPGKPGSKTWFEAFRLAHYNRCTLSITQAGHSDGVKTPVPQVGEGKDVKVKDWTAYDEAFGPLCDGSAFKGLPRDGEPIATLHIPMSHGTPLGVNKYYKYDGPKSGKGAYLFHALLTKSIDEGYGDDFKAGFQSFARQFVQHSEEKNWTGPTFMFYMDGKPNYREDGGGTSYWTLDEPYNYDDWMALRFFGKLFRDGTKDSVKKTHWGFRCDISRPQWTRDWLNGVMTHMYVGGFMAKIKRSQLMGKEGPMTLYAYGACNRPNVSHWNSTAWCLQTYLAGGEGVLPWQSMAYASNVDSLKQEDANGLVVLDKLGKNAFGSIRLMALRRGAQDVEYLITLGEKYGLNREQLKQLVTTKISDKAESLQKNADDAAPVDFKALDPDKFAELREGLAKLIEAKK